MEKAFNCAVAWLQQPEQDMEAENESLNLFIREVGNELNQASQRTPPEIPSRLVLHFQVILSALQVR